MRKIFTLFAAMLLAITASATTKWSITPDKADTLKATIERANDGDTILLAKGSAAYTIASAADIDKTLTIMAADMSNRPEVKAKVFYPSGSSRIKFVGVKFDASAVEENLFSAADNANATILYFENCDFYGDTANSALIYCGSGYLLDSLVIDSCYFHNIKKSCIFLENSGMKGLKITNSTFANIATVKEKYYAAPIQTKGTSTRVDVNNCTFYDCITMSSDYGAIGCRTDPSTNVLVQNCIFALASTNASIRAVYVAGGNVKNCLTYNYGNDSGHEGIHSGPTRSDCLFKTDPKFVNVATGYTLAENSPAHEAGVGGTHLGDPRWWPNSWQPAIVKPVTSIELDKKSLAIDVNETAFLHTTVLPADATDPSVNWISKNNAIATVANGVVKGIASGEVMIIAKAGEKADTCTVTVSAAIPSTNFASPYFLKGTKAELAGNIYVSETDSLHYKDKSECGTATWKLHSDTVGFVTATINFKAGSASGAKLKIQIIDGDENVVSEDSLAYWEHDGDKTLPRSLFIPAKGDYTIKLFNTQSWSSAKLKGITLARDVNKDVAFKGAWDKWTVHNATFAADGTYASATFYIGVVENSEFGLTLGESFRANGYGYHRGFPGCAGITGNSGNMKLTTDYAGNYTFKWYYANDSIAITFPEKTLENGWYLVGTFNGASAWNIEDLTAAKMFVVNTEETEKTEYMITVPLTAGDVFKAAYVYLGAFTEHKPNGTGNDYTVDAEHAGASKTIYLRPNNDGDGSWWYSVLYVPANDPTSIDNTVAGEKAVKFFENGQLFIQKDGKTYNILGTIVK